MIAVILFSGFLAIVGYVISEVIDNRQLNQLDKLYKETAKKAKER